MVVKKTLTALGLTVALAVAPTFAYAQSQVAKTGTGAQTGAVAGQEESTTFGLTATQIALVAALGIAAIVVGVTALSDDGDDDVAGSSSTSTSTATTTSTN